MAGNSPNLPLVKVTLDAAALRAAMPTELAAATLGTAARRRSPRSAALAAAPDFHPRQV